LVLSVLLRVELLTDLAARSTHGTELVAVALIASHGVARFPAVLLLFCLPYVTPAGGKSGHVTRPGLPQLLVAVSWVVILSLVLLWTSALPIHAVACLLGAAGLVALVLGRRFRTRAGGLTGDFLGATEQFAEVAALLVLVVAV
jgi:adenosylcobinamide-GDP ribazoletransferase